MTPRPRCTRFPARDVTHVEFRLLGPLDSREGGHELRLVPPKQRALLALLLLRRGEPVPVDRIAEELWAGDPPTTAARAVRVYVG